MDLSASHDTDEFGSVYSFDGLYNKIKKHNLVYPALSTSPGSPCSSISPKPTPEHIFTTSSPGRGRRRPPGETDFFKSYNPGPPPPPPNYSSNGAAVTGSGFRRFSVFSQPMPQYNGGGLVPPALTEVDRKEQFKVKSVALDGESVRKSVIHPDYNPEYKKLNDAAYTLPATPDLRRLRARSRPRPLVTSRLTLNYTPLTRSRASRPSTLLLRQSSEPFIDPATRRLSWEISRLDSRDEMGHRHSCSYSDIATPTPHGNLPAGTLPARAKMTSNLPECFFRCFVMAMFLTLYMCIGAAVFCAIEQEQEKLHAQNLRNMWSTFQSVNDIPQNLMDKFLKEHYTACEMGDQHHAGNQLQWDYISSLFFTGTILTTIGYGHSVPSTLGGRVFTIFYAIAGIPFMLGLLNVVAEIFLTTLKIIKSKIKKKPCPDVFHHEVFISALLGVIILLIFMTFMFKIQESTWTYEQSIYFSFITMTTIGFGDFVPAQVNVTNNSPNVITREFFNLILIFISVLIWYFLSQVSAQVLKVRLKGFYRQIENSNFARMGTNAAGGGGQEQSHNNSCDYDDVSEHPRGGGVERCTCVCTCGYNDHTESVSCIAEDENSDSDSGGPLGLGNNNQDQGSKRTILSSSSSCSSSSSSSPSQMAVDSTPDPHPSSYSPPLKIPSIVITPVDHNSIKKTPKTEASLQICQTNSDSGKGSSEMTFSVPSPCDQTPRDRTTSDSSTSLVSINSSYSTPEVYVKLNGFSKPSSPKMKRSQSEQVGRSLSNLSKLNGYCTHRLSRSLTDLQGAGRPAPERRYTSVVEYRTADHTFSIHTKLFDDMIK